MQIAVAKQRRAGEDDGDQFRGEKGESRPTDTAETKGLDAGRGLRGARYRQQIRNTTQQQGLKGEIGRAQ